MQRMVEDGVTLIIYWTARLYYNKFDSSSELLNLLSNQIAQTYAVVRSDWL